MVTNAGNPRRDARAAAKRLDPALGPRLPTVQDPSSATVAAIEDPKALRERHPPSGRERHGADNAAIDTDGPADVDRDLVLDRTREADAATRVTQPNRGVLNITPQRAGLAELPDLGQSRLEAGIEAAHLGLPTLERRRMVAALTRRGVPGAALEELVERPIEIPQGLLLACLGDAGEPIELSTQKRLLTALNRVAPPRPHMATALPSPDRTPRALSGGIGSAVKSGSNAGRFALFAICALSLNDEHGRARFCPGLKAGASARDSR